MRDQAGQIARKHAADRGHPTPAARRGSAKTRGAGDGTLLIELLVVLAILALISSIALPRAQTIGRGPSLGLVASDIAAKLRAARSMSVAQNRDVAFVLDTNARTYGVAGTRAPQTLPANINFAVTTARQQIREAKEARLVFFSDGTSSGGTIRLTDERQSVAIGVEWLTGAVHIERGEP